MLVNEVKSTNREGAKQIIIRHPLLRKFLLGFCVNSSYSAPSAILPMALGLLSMSDFSQS